MRLLLPFAIAGSALALAACGSGSSSKTVTVVQTVTKLVDAAPATTTPATTTTTDAPAGKPLPAGVTALDGSYDLTADHTDYTGENIVAGDTFGGRWVFATTCRGKACSVLMRRQFRGGTYKSITLKPDPQRDDVYVGTAGGTTDCAIGEAHPPTQTRYSVKINASSDVGGRTTADRIDVLYTEKTNGCPTKPSRGIISWRAVRRG
jgi:hypothetical protein